jgi:aspartyl-tRNA synthetase
LRESHVGTNVHLCGWVATVRAHGAVAFIDLRDRYGITQVVLNKKSKDFEKAKTLALESCIRVTGEVVTRKAGTENKDIPTGTVEVACHDLEIFNSCPPMPFMLNDESVNEDIRLKYRYLDLRSDRLRHNLILRHKLYKAIHTAMDHQGFLNVETPILYKSTPEGARDYIVPSRLHPGKFYALPQSPQLFKQLLMMANYDRYYQIAKCFRDEDSRADRQPEFTQLDIEMAFIDREDIIHSMEKVVAFVFKEALGVELTIPFPRMSYDEAMKKYNSDKPDIRKKGERFAFLWVLDFPMFEYREEDKRWYAMHHPFTSPMPNSNFAKPETIKAKAYDLVLNGVEIGGGSIRIHDRETQSKVFKVLGISEEEAQSKFGFLLDALSHGAPPHGGIAFGLDRFLQLMTGSKSIREVIAFPKNQAAQDLMLDTPSDVTDKRLKEAHIKIDVKETKKK